MKLIGSAKGGVSLGLPSFPGKVLGASIGGSAGTSGTSSSTDTNQLSKYKDIAHSVMASSHYNENVDVLTRASKDASLRKSSENGSRYLHDVSHSLDKADHARQEWTATLQKADYLRKTASFMNDKGTGFRDNLNQEFIEFIAKQPNQHGTHEIGMPHANTILHDQQLRERYAEQFLQHKVENIMQKLPNGIMNSERNLHHQFQNNASNIGSTSHIEAINKSHHDLQNHLDHIKPYNHATASDLHKDVEEKFTKQENKIQQSKQSINEAKLKQENNTNVEFEKYKRQNIYRNFMGLKEVNNDNGK